MSLMSGIHLALRSLLTQQQVIEVIEHNVANAGTEGYHRQEAVLVAGQAYPAPSIMGGTIPGQMGSGVMVDQIRRFNLDFYDSRYNTELALSKKWEAKGDVLAQVETTLGETTSDGLISKLDEFWNGWQQLSSDPSNMALRADLRERAQALVDGLNSRAKNLMALREDQDLAIKQRVEEVNNLATQVAKLNLEISQVKAAGDEPNDLMDQREQAIERLAELVGAKASEQANGEVLVSVGNHALVIGATTFELETRPDSTNSNMASIYFAQDDVELKPSSGELAGLLEARDVDIVNQLDGLDTLAATLVAQVNAAHNDGYALNGTTTNIDFFDANFTTAYDIRLSDEIESDLNNIAAASTASAAGDGNNAVAIVDLQNQLFMSSGTETINGFYTSQIGNLGLELQSAQTRAEDRQTVVESLNNLRESTTGVNLDEEAANLVKAQKAYQASARIMTALDEMLNQIINGLGLVGR